MEKCERCDGTIHPGDRHGRKVDPDSGKPFHGDCWEQEVRSR